LIVALISAHAQGAGRIVTHNTTRDTHDEQHIATLR
jgi:hypothetical protein